MSVARADAASPSTSGVYVGGGNLTGFSSFASWLGQQPAHILDFNTDTSWSTIDNPDWVDGEWANSGAQLTLSIPMLPASGATLAQGATGAYNSYFTTLADNLVASGESNAIIRLGWEMNGNWFPWSIENGASAYASYWQQIVTTMRAVDPSLKFDFCASAGSSYVNGVPLDPESAYPGDAYVNDIGLDLYDQSWVSDASVEANRWQGYLTGSYGLEWQQSFAAAHGKPVSFPEWGLWPAGSHGGGDSPAFVQDMYNWMSQSNLAYQDYFDDSTSALGSYPSADTLYKQLFGPTTTTTPTPPPTTTTTTPTPPPTTTTTTPTPPPTTTTTTKKSKPKRRRGASTSVTTGVASAAISASSPAVAHVGRLAQIIRRTRVTRHSKAVTHAAAHRTHSRPRHRRS